jgi:transcription elongation factor Elf1
MPDYFDCMRCGHMSLVSTKPPKCPKCGSGAGVVVTRATPPDEMAERDSAPPKKDSGQQ